MPQGSQDAGLESLPSGVVEVILKRVEHDEPGLVQTTLASCSSASKWFKGKVREYDPEWQGQVALRGLSMEELDQKLPRQVAVPRVGTAVVTEQQRELPSVVLQLSSCTALTDIRLTSAEKGFHGACLEPLSALPYLSAFSLELHAAPAGMAAAFQSLAGCSKLRSLSITVHTSGDDEEGEEGEAMGAATLGAGFQDAAGDAYPAITQLRQLVRLELSGPNSMLPPAMVASFTALQQLRHLTFHCDNADPMSPALVDAFTSLASMRQLTALHLVRGGPWDQGSNKEHYLARGPSCLVEYLAGFTQLLELSVIIDVEDIHKLAPLTSLQCLRLIVPLPDEDGVDELVQEPLEQLSGLRKLHTLWVELVSYDPESLAGSITGWGLDGLPPALAKLPKLHTVGLPGHANSALRTTSSTVKHLVLEGAGVNLEAAALAVHPNLLSLEAYDTSRITTGPTRSASLLTRLVLQHRVYRASIVDGRLLSSSLAWGVGLGVGVQRLPTLLFAELPAGLRELELSDFVLQNKAHEQPFRLSSLTKLRLSYSLVPDLPLAKLLQEQLGLSPLVDLGVTVNLLPGTPGQPQTLQIWALDLYNLELLCSWERGVCKWLQQKPYSGAGVVAEAAADAYLHAYLQHKLPDAKMDSLYREEAALGRAPAITLRKGLLPWLIHLRDIFPGSSVEPLLTSALPPIPNLRTWYRSYALALRPDMLADVTAAAAPFLLQYTHQGAQQVLTRLAEVYTTAAAAPSNATYHMRVKCAEHGSSGCRIDLSFAARARGAPGKPWEWAVTGPEQPPLGTLGVLLRLLPVPDGLKQPVRYRFTCVDGQLVQRTFCIAAAVLVSPLHYCLGWYPARSDAGVLVLEGVQGADLRQLLQQLFEAGQRHPMIKMPDLEAEMSCGQSSLASQVRMTRFLGPGRG